MQDIQFPTLPEPPTPYIPDALPDDTIFPEEVISEQIDELGKSIKKPLKRQMKAVEKIAQSSKTQADIALKKSKRADIKGWLAIGISAAALLIEVIVNRIEILAFLKSLFN